MTHADEPFVGGGEMAKVMREIDWSKTPLGPTESWPQSLRTTVSLVQASNSPISLSWGPGHVQIYNDGYWPICGEKHPQSMGQDFRECWASAFPVIGEAYATAWSGRSAYLEKVRMFLDRYGFLEETWFTFSFSPIMDESGGVGGLFHPVTEMTSQMLSERRTRALRDLAIRAGKARTTEEAFAASAQVLAESSLDLPFVLFYLIDPNGSQARLIGHTGLVPGTPVCPPLVDTGPTAGKEALPIAEVARTGVTQQFDNGAQLFAGMTVGPYPEIPTTGFVLPMYQPGSERPAAIMVAGVSARLRVDESYRGFYDLVVAAVGTSLANARAYEEERDKSAALAEIDRAKTAFFSNVSHEFRTPLTLILGPIADGLADRDEPLPPRQRERQELVERNALRLMRLVNSLLDFSRIEAGRVRACYEATDVSMLTADLASVFRCAVEKADLRFVVECPPLAEPIWVDRDMWQKIVSNLLSNAFKFTFAGEIRLVLRVIGDSVELAVSDTGVGISPEEMPRLFERFHRVEGARARTHEGSGIGLALVQELAKLHGGSVRAESEPDRGTTFWVTVPLGSEHLPKDRIAEAATTPTTTDARAFANEAARWLPDAAATQAEPATPGTRILVADDNADLRDYLRRILDPHWTVEIVEDGVMALASAKASPPDLVLTDVMMPRLDGFGLLRELRSDARTRSVPIVMLSARAGEEARVEGLEAGADDYLVKPFSAREVIARVRSQLELVKMRREIVRHADVVRLNEQLELRVAERTTQLERSNRELEKFAYVASHDLRSPLRAIGLLAEWLEDDVQTGRREETSEHVRLLRGRVQRLDRLLSDLLEYARAGCGSGDKVEKVDSARLLAEVIELSAVPKGFVVTAGSTMPILETPVVPLQQVFMNLIGNAIKHHDRTTGCVTFSAREVGAYWQFSVADDGPGILPRFHQQAFEMFQTLKPRDAVEGSGMGLALVKKVVESSGGEIALESSGRGSTFRFTWPKKWDTGGTARQGA